MLKGNRTVHPADEREARRDGTCFYCREPIGGTHKANCIIPQRTVVVDFTIRLVTSEPEGSSKEDIEFHYNDASWCAGNVLAWLRRLFPDDDHGRCPCACTEAVFVREATAEDEEGYGIANRDPETKRVGGSMPEDRTVFLAVNYEYDSTEILGIASTQEKAEAYRPLGGGDGFKIEEWVLDARLDRLGNGLLPYRVEFRMTEGRGPTRVFGEFDKPWNPATPPRLVASVNMDAGIADPPDGVSPTMPFRIRDHNSREPVFGVWASSAKEAEKLARAARRALKGETAQP